MKRLISCLLIMVILFQRMPVFATTPESTEGTIEATDVIEPAAGVSSIHGIDANNALLGMERLVKNTRSAVVYEANSETLMYAWNPDMQMYPASFVKIMTVLLAIENTQLTDLVTISQEAISSVPSDAVSVKPALLPGEKLSVQDLLYCILLSSASDACVAIAEHIGGSVSGFVDMMNQRAAEMGCTGTHFTNPHGLHDDNQHTTARDSARILSEAMANETFREIFSADDYMIEKTNLCPDVRRITTGNYMKNTDSKLYYDSRVIGGRTGVTQDGRRCLATASERNGMMLITIVMGSDSVYQEDGFSAISIGGYLETTELLDICLDGYKTAQLLFENQALRQIDVSEGDCDLVIGPQVSVSSVLPVDITTDDLVFEYTDKTIEIPVEKGQHISDLRIWHGNMCVAQAELYALHDVKAADHITQLTFVNESEERNWALWLIIGAAVLGGCFLIFRYGRRRKMSVRGKRHRENRKQRRR